MSEMSEARKRLRKKAKTARKAKRHFFETGSGSGLHFWMYSQGELFVLDEIDNNYTRHFEHVPEQQRRAAIRKAATYA